MKNIKMILITILLLLTSAIVVGSSIDTSYDDSDCCQININYYFKSPEIKEIEMENNTYVEIKLENYSNFYGAGRPVLPVESSKILLPPDKKFIDVDLSISEAKVISLDHLVKPGQQMIPIGSKDIANFTPPDPDIYNSDKIYPDKIWEVANIQRFRGYNVLMLRFYPVRYIPSEKSTFIL